MRAVVSPEAGSIEVNWSWLPTFIGLNQKLQREIVEDVTPRIVGRVLDDETLDLAHDLVVTKIVNTFPSIEGLRDYLDGLKFIRHLSDGEQKEKS